MKTELQKKVAAVRSSVTLGCSGAHQSKDGEWLPCSSLGELLHTAFGDEVKSRITPDDIRAWRSRRKKRGKRKRTSDNWEKLGQRGVMGIDTLPGGGLVSAVTGGSRPPITNGYQPPAGMSVKSVQPMYSPRDDDNDVFTDVESARRRSRQLGCIGVSRRISKTGKTVWMPCTNMSDYARLTGTTALGRRHMAAATRGVVRTVVREELKRRKKSIIEELSNKSIGRRIGSAARSAELFDANAIDGDEDGIVQDGTPFQRPATPTTPKNPLSEDQIRKLTSIYDSMSPGEKEKLKGESIELYDPKFTNKNRGLQSSSRPPNPYKNIGGKEMGRIILGRVKPEHRRKTGKRTFYLIGGTTGAGKGRVLQDHLQKNGLVPQSDEAAHIDPDFIKLGLPGYDDGRGASRVHHTSRISTDHVIRDAASQGMDMIVEGTGKRYEHPRDARARGEKVVAHFVHTPSAIASGRARSRQAETGRSIPDFSSRIASQLPPAILEQFSYGLLDEFYLWDNEDENSPPKLIASKTPGKPMKILNRDKWIEFSQGERMAERLEKAANSSQQ